MTRACKSRPRNISASRILTAVALAATLALSACSGSSRAVSAYDGTALVAASARSKDAARDVTTARTQALALSREITRLERQIARDERRLASSKTSKRNRARAQGRLDRNVPKLRASMRESRRAERALRRAERLERRAELQLTRAERRKARAQQRIAAASVVPARVTNASAPRRTFLDRILGDGGAPVAQGGVQATPAVLRTEPRRGFFGSSDPAYEFAEDYGAKSDDGFAVAAIPIDQMDKRLLRQRVNYRSPHKPGTVVVDTGARYLYLVQKNNTAIRYGIGVGREGFAWSGSAHIGFKRKWPTWTPPVEMIARQPELAKYCADCGGMPGGPSNPLGARALYLVKDGKDTLFRLHGTPQWRSIGTAASSGCIRMMHQDVMDLYRRVPAGTTVVVF